MNEGGLWEWGIPLRGSSVRGPWRMCKGRLWRQASLSIGATLGNLEGGSYTRDIKR